MSKTEQLKAIKLSSKNKKEEVLKQNKIND